MTTQRSIVRGTSGVFEALFVEDDGTPIVPIDLTMYPSISIVSPDATIIQTGVATSMGSGRWRYIWIVPGDAQLSANDSYWQINWTVVVAGNRQIQFNQAFGVTDHIESTPNERAYTQLVQEGNPERLVIKFRVPQNSLTLSLRGGTETVDLSSSITEVEQDGFYCYYADTDDLSYGCFLASWRARETVVSQYQTYLQQIRVPEDLFWILQPDLRMLIDKVQKKDGHVQSYSDSDMYSYMKAGTDIINQADPISMWQFTDFPSAYGFWTYLIAASAWWGLQAQFISEGELKMNFCFAGDTLVSTPKGNIKIKDLVGDLPPGLHNKILKLTTPNGIRETSKVFVSEPVETVKILTYNGYEVTCTKNEPLLVLTEDLNFSWVTVENLKPGNFVITNTKQESVVENPDISWIPDRVKSEHYANIHTPPKLPDKITPELARLLGYLIAEGCTTGKENVLFTNTDEELLSDFSRCAEFVFGKTPNPMGFNILPSGKCCKSIGILGRISRKSLYYCDVLFSGANTKEVPEIIMQSSDEIVLEFLRAFFSGDGHASKFGSFCSSSAKLLQQIQILLLRLGYISRRQLETIDSDDRELSKLLTKASSVLLQDGYTKRSLVYKKFSNLVYSLAADGYKIGVPGNKTYQLTIRGPSWDSYIENVGFISTKQKNRSIADQSEKRYPQRESLPKYVLDFLSSFHTKYGSKGWYVCTDGKHRRLNLEFRENAGVDFYAEHLQYYHLENYLNACRDSLVLVCPEILHKIEKLLKYRFHFEEIIDISPDDLQKTYDVCLDNSEDDLPHAFIANGFVVHNSGQTVTLDVDRTSTYEAAISRLREYLTTDMPRTKANMIRRANVGAIATRPYDFGLSSLVCRVQQVNGGSNQILPLMSRLGLV